MELSLKLFTGYNLFTAALFIFMNATVAPQALADWDATHPSASPVVSDALAQTLVAVYYQVIGTMSLMLALTALVPGSMGRLLSMLALVSCMAKHITVDGLLPPPPVMGMAGITLLLCLFSVASDNEGYSKWSFALYNAITSATFALAPQTPLRDTFAALPADGETLAFGLLLMEVVAYLTYTLAIVTALAPSLKGYALGMLPGLALIYKHVLIDKSGPPAPVMWFNIVTTLLLAKDAFLAAPAAEKGGKKTE